MTKLEFNVLMSLRVDPFYILLPGERLAVDDMLKEGWIQWSGGRYMPTIKGDMAYLAQRTPFDETIEDMRRERYRDKKRAQDAQKKSWKKYPYGGTTTTLPLGQRQANFTFSGSIGVTQEMKPEMIPKPMVQKIEIRETTKAVPKSLIWTMEEMDEVEAVAGRQQFFGY